MLKAITNNFLPLSAGVTAVGIMSHVSPLIPPSQDTFHRQSPFPMLAAQAAQKHGLNKDVFVAQMRQESGFNPQAVSPAGAVGIAQITPETAKHWGVDPTDPEASLDAAARNMAAYKRTYERQGHDEETSLKLALSAYNAGPEAVAKHHGIPKFKETINYVKSIMRAFHRKEKA